MENPEYVFKIFVPPFHFLYPQHYLPKGSETPSQKFQWTHCILECTKKVCSVCSNHLFQIFPQARQPSSVSELLKKCVGLCFGIYLIKTKLRVFWFLKIDEHAYPYLVFSRQYFFLPKCFV